MRNSAYSTCYALLFTLVAFVAQGCGNPLGIGGASDGPSASSASEYQQDVAFIYSSVTSIEVEVAYETGAEPYTSQLRNGDPLWSVAIANINALFSRRAMVPAVSVPTSLAQMKPLGAQNRTSWTIDDILSVANTRRAAGSTLDTARYFIMFVKGYYNEGGADQRSVLGVQITGTSVIAIFKDVVRAQSLSPASPTLRYIEQATVIHELGHGLGLVNHGVPMTSNHQDPDNGAHCSNPDCVMHWQNEGQADYADFIEHAIESGNKVMFGAECLDDTNSYRP